MALKWDLEAERDLWTALCAPNRWFGEDGETPTTHPDALWNFIALAWGTEWYFKKRKGEVRWLQPRVHKPLVDWLQYHLLKWLDLRAHGSDDRYYIAVVWPRQFGKTVIATKCATLWTHLADADMSTLFFSATHPLSKSILQAVQEVISGKNRLSWFTWLYGNWYDPLRKWDKQECVHSFREMTSLSEPSFDTTGVEIGMTGYHHDQHCIDDPIYANKLREGGTYMTTVHTGVDACYNALKPNGLMMMDLTRYLDDDVAGRHQKREGIATWAGMPCPNMTLFEKVPLGQGIWHVNFWQTENEETGEPTLPEVYNRQKIKEHKSRDPEDFACQQQNNPGSGEHSPLVERQIHDIYTDYRILKGWAGGIINPIASIHIDTAFKKKESIGKGDDSAIVVWLHDERTNGLIYLDTELLRASNEWRAEDFHAELIKVCVNLRMRGIRIKCVTDEADGGGKADVYPSVLKAVLNGAGFYVPVYQLNRQGTKKRSRIRKAAAHWAEGYVRVLLHRQCQCPPHLPSLECPHWRVPPLALKFFNQMLRIDAVDHEDLADAAADVFIEELPNGGRIWRRPLSINYFTAGDEGAYPVQPFDDETKRNPLSHQMVEQIEDTEREAASWMGPGHGPDDYLLPPREPV